MGLPPQVVTFALHRDDFTTLVAPARTFTFAAWVDAQRSQGLIRGGSLDNAIVLDAKGKPVNPPLRCVSSITLKVLIDVASSDSKTNRHGTSYLTALVTSHSRVCLSQPFLCSPIESFAGHPIYGIFTAELPSHKLSHELLGALFSSPTNYDVEKST
jgi:UDP-3-O-acyl-N-acetylglucosamine deacetylase